MGQEIKGSRFCSGHSGRRNLLYQLFQGYLKEEVTRTKPVVLCITNGQGREASLRQQNSSSIGCIPSRNPVEALFVLMPIPLIPDFLLGADGRSGVHRVLEQGTALSISCGRYSSGRRKHKTVMFV